MASVSFVGLRATGYVIGILLFVLGRYRKRPKVAASGVVLLGVMVLATPLTWYLYLVSEGGSIRFAATDVILLSWVAFLGGLVAGAGLWLLLGSPGVAGKR